MDLEFDWKPNMTYATEKRLELVMKGAEVRI